MHQLTPEVMVSELNTDRLSSSRAAGDHVGCYPVAHEVYICIESID